MYPLQDVFESLRKPGLYGIYSVSEMGKAALLACFASSFSAAGDQCLFITLENTEDHLLKRIRCRISSAARSAAYHILYSEITA